MSSGQPAGEVAAGGVPNRQNTAQVKRVPGGELTQIIGSSGGVQKRAGPPASGVTQPAILDIPGGQARRGKGGADMAEIAQIVSGAIVAAVHSNHYWIRAAARFRQA